MKSLFVFLLMGVSVALAAKVFSAAAGPAQSSNSTVDPGPNVCCFNYVARPIPLILLESFQYTNGRCSKPAVIFFTKKGREICADPSEQWVRDRIRDLSPH